MNKRRDEQEKRWTREKKWGKSEARIKTLYFVLSLEFLCRERKAERQRVPTKRLEGRGNSVRKRREMSHLRESKKESEWDYGSHSITSKQQTGHMVCICSHINRPIQNRPKADLIICPLTQKTAEMCVFCLKWKITLLLLQTEIT